MITNEKSIARLKNNMLRTVKLDRYRDAVEIQRLLQDNLDIVLQATDDFLDKEIQDNGFDEDDPDLHVSTPYNSFDNASDQAFIGHTEESLWPLGKYAPIPLGKYDVMSKALKAVSRDTHGDFYYQTDSKTLYDKPFVERDFDGTPMTLDGKPIISHEVRTHYKPIDPQISSDLFEGALGRIEDLVRKPIEDYIIM